MKLEFMQPIIERIAFMHARIGSRCCIQMPVGSCDGRADADHGNGNYLADYRRMWSLTMSEWRRRAAPGDFLVFCPELLRPAIYYARLVPGPDGRPREESDRYAEALRYLEIARDCFAG